MTKDELKLQQLRFTGNKGTPILPHRSLRKLDFKISTLLTMILLPLIFVSFIWVNLQAIMNLWGEIHSFWINVMHLDTRIAHQEINIFWHLFQLPFPDLAVTLPTKAMLWWNLLVCVILLLLSLAMPRNLKPFAYLLRAALIIQLSASVYFWFSPDRDPYALPQYFAGMFTVGTYFLLLTPPLMALTYYIFNFETGKKFILTFIMVAYFIVFLPFQYLLHGLIISSFTPLFTPLLYLLFGPLLDVFLLVCWYSFAMTWDRIEDRQSSLQ